MEKPNTQWMLKVKLIKLDTGALDPKKKNKWNVNDSLTVSIEPHGTVNMLKQRIALIVMAHPKHQIISTPEGEVLDDCTKLEEVKGLCDGGQIDVSVEVPKEPEAPPVEISDDEGLAKDPDSEAALPELPDKELMSKELSDADMDKQGDLKQQAQDALEDGKLDEAVAKFTEAMMLGSVSAMMLAKRAEMLMKQKRYKAAAADASAALELNPDSAKAYRVRGKARRLLGDYEGSSTDLSQAQKIDYDDGVADLHTWVHKRVEKMKLKAKQDAKKAEAEEASKATGGYAAS
eukprot:TRINITY_DN60548_c0_g1_i1.p1 TRINITY_DN60548_c0_g1~~TRINITY_DN60548_c0_g1_i1.p1  ORF type:complete len:331 (-),score=93.32 TRINITY_DN60548_c0_g1_i1:332-1201(-)